MSSGPLDGGNVIERETYEQFIRDLGFYVREQAIAAKRQRDDARAGSEQKSLSFGRAVAYSEVISAMQDYLRAFAIPLENMCLQDFDPDELL